MVWILIAVALALALLFVAAVVDCEGLVAVNCVIDK
jgi:hypothetical protein